MGFCRAAIIYLVWQIVCACSAGSNGEPPNQGALQQTAAGQIIANLSNRGIAGDPRFSDQSAVVLYLYKKKDYSLGCTSATDKKKCEDRLIFQNERVDSLGFTNEPGYFGFDADFTSYRPLLSADAGHVYPAAKPADPAGFSDADIWQCFRNPFPGNPNYNKFECGVNAHPIRYLNRQLTTYTVQVYAADGKGYASSYVLDYNLFNSMNHPVKDGDRYYAYFAVYFNAMRVAVDAEDRFDFSSKIWKRPIEPDLVSPRIEINIKLLPEGPHDKAGSSYDIPDYSTWYDPFVGCTPTNGVVGSVYFSEILWMGSKDTGGTGALEDEFVELYNNTGTDINVSGWKLHGVGAGDGAVTLPLCSVIKANSVYTVGLQTSRAFTKFDFVSPAVSLSNSGEATFSVADAAGNTISSISGCTTGPWGANGINGGSGVPKRSMRLTSITVPATTCATGGAGFWSTTSVADANYNTASDNVSAAYKAAADTGNEGTVATPGIAGP